jgi:hypothetical protein
MAKRSVLLGCTLLLIGCIALLQTGCGQATPQPPNTPSAVASATDPTKLVGRSCVVYLRYDALGTSSDSPKPAFTDVMDGAEVSLRGTLQEINNHWVIVQQNRVSDKRVLWIPMSSVLSVALDFPNDAVNTSDSHGHH